MVQVVPLSGRGSGHRGIEFSKFEERLRFFSLLRI